MSSHKENNDRSNYTPAAGASGSISNIPFITDNVIYIQFHVEETDDGF